MTEPTLSELYAKLASLRARIERLQPPGEVEPPPPTDGTIIHAGTIFYCRPSKFRELASRLGGMRNIEIMDTEETAGFARGKHVDPKPWTNEVYPTDIGPSCAGIDSNTSRVAVTSVNNCITPTLWDPAKLFFSPSHILRYRTSLSGTYIMRTMIVHKDPWSYENRNSFMHERFMYYGKIKHPALAGSNGVGAEDFYDDFQYIVYSTDPQSKNFPVHPGQNYIMKDFQELRETAQKMMNLPDTNFTVLGDNDLCFMRFFGNTPGGGSIISAPTPALSIPFQIPMFKIYSNKLEMGDQTPVLKYGGYDRRLAKTSGPTPHWNRTNIVQFKIKKDVAVVSLASSS